MQTVDFWDALARRVPGILIISFLFAGVAYVFIQKIPPSYETHVSYALSLDQREVSSSFRYDGYYAASAVELYAGTLAALISSPETIVQAHAAAGMSAPSAGSIQLRKVVQAEKAAAGLVHITVTQSSAAQAEKLTQGVMKVADNFFETSEVKGSATMPWTSTEWFAAMPGALVVFVFVFLIGCMRASFRYAHSN